MYNIVSSTYEDTHEIVTTIKIMTYKEALRDNRNAHYFGCVCNKNSSSFYKY